MGKKKHFFQNLQLVFPRTEVRGEVEMREERRGVRYEGGGAKDEGRGVKYEVKEEGRGVKYEVREEGGGVSVQLLKSLLAWIYLC